jgi:hypothetical protein
MGKKICSLFFIIRRLVLSSSCHVPRSVTRFSLEDTSVLLTSLNTVIVVLHRCAVDVSYNKIDAVLHHCTVDVSYNTIDAVLYKCAFDDF